MPGPARYVIYVQSRTAISIPEQSNLRSQERDISVFLHEFSPVPFEVIGKFVEHPVSGKTRRPELEKALELVRRTGADLLLAKFDRLNRHHSFVDQLIEDDSIPLRVASMPYALKSELSVYSRLGKQERAFIAARTKAALVSAKARGARIGGQRKADVEAERLLPIVLPMVATGMPKSKIAENLQKMGIPTSRGGTWTSKQVFRLLARSNPL